MRECYGIAGRKGHGKDTFAKMVCRSRPEFVILHFADALKQILVDVFNLNPRQLEDSRLKEAPFAFPIEIDAFLPQLRATTNLEMEPAGKVATTPRQLMQLVGTDYVRRVQDDFWIRRLLVEIERHDYVLVADVRFRNEAAAIRTVSGKIIKIIRLDSGAEAVAEHSSEAEIDNIGAEVVVNAAKGDLCPLQAAVALLQPSL
jgi:hypothetical protein